MSNSLLIFGGGELQVSIIKKAKQLGFLTIVIDPNPEAIARAISDVFIQVDGDDLGKTLDIARDFNVRGVITAATDHPILMMCKVAAELSLKFASHESCHTLLDKGIFKSFLKKHNLPHARGSVFRFNIEHDIKDYRFPVIVKPVRNSGSRGVIKCDCYQSLSAAINECIPFCRDGSFIIEEYIEGSEISVEAIVVDRKVQIIQITDKYVSAPPYNVELGHIQPSKFISRRLEIQEILQKIVDLIGLNNCAIHPELKINNEGEVIIIEIGPRLGGDYITSVLTPLSTGIDIEELQICISTGLPFQLRRLNMYSSISFLNFPVEAIIVDTIDQDALIKLFPEVISFSFSLKVGTRVRAITNSIDRYGYFIIQASSIDEIESLTIKINDFLFTKLLSND